MALAWTAAMGRIRPSDGARPGRGALVRSRRESSVEALPLMLGIVLMLVAAIGIVFYVALVIAIPVCRMLDWFSGKPDNARNASEDSPNVIRLLRGRLDSRGRSVRSPNDHDS
jgi:hypothetical protein